MRTHISFATLDPRKRAENIVWLRGRGTTRELHDHEQFERFLSAFSVPGDAEDRSSASALASRWAGRRGGINAIAEPVEAAGGEMLEFMGDGLLAAFPVLSGASTACDAALAAARDAIGRTALVNDAYPETPRLDLDIALHLGEVFYGNIGAASRLGFTVIGPAVNEAARLEDLRGRLDHALLMSESFARACSEPVISLGRFELRGVSGRREIFRLEKRNRR